MIVTRIVLLGAVIAVIAVATHRLHDVRACRSASEHSGRLAFREISGSPKRAVDRVLAVCPDEQIVAQNAGILLFAGDVADAQRLARAAVHRAPRDSESWIAMAYVLARAKRPQAAARALRRAHQLNPLSALTRATPRGAVGP